MPTTWIQSIGCQMSSHDGERIGELLRAGGYDDAASVDEADVVVLTTCSVREKARQKVRSAVGRMKRVKSRRPDQIIVIAGCVAQQDGRRIIDEAAHVDVVVGSDHLWRVPELVEQVQLTGERVCVVGFEESEPSTFLPLGEPSGPSVSAYVTIQKGCDERCAFCIVPQVRGPGRCRPLEEVLEEVEAHTGRGAREIVFLGQTVNSYRWGEAGFSDLLKQTAGVSGVDRIRYESAHPRFLSDDLIETHRDSPQLCEHLHLPVQSGSDAVLERMGRGHTRAEFLGWLERLRATCHGVGLSTDLFVGFPGESDDDFRATLDLVDAVSFDSAYTFKYSPRPGTPAARWDDDVPLAEKSERLRLLQELQAMKTAHALQKLVGNVVEVLVEGESKAGGQLRGRSRRNTVVNIDLSSESSISEGGLLADRASLMGKLVQVEVTEAGGHSVRGRLVPKRMSQRGGAEFAA